MNELAARKQALITRSEVHRQTLALELQNLRVYIARKHRTFALLRLVRPVLFLLPILGPLLALKRRAGRESASPPASRWRRALSGGLFAWRLYRKFGPALQRALSGRRRRESDPALD